MSRSARAHLMLLGIVFIWGFTFVVVKEGIADAAPWVFNFLRMVVAASVLAVVYRSKLLVVNRKMLLGCAVVGVCLAAGYHFQTTGLEYTTPTKSAFITGTVVVIVPLLSAFKFLRSAGQPRPGWRVALGAAFAFAGLIFLTTPPGTHFDELLRSVNKGDWLTLGCAVSFSFHLLAIGWTSRWVPIPQLAFLQTVFAMLLIGATGAVVGHPYLHWTTRLVVALLITGVLATALAFAVQSWAQTILPATHVAVILTMEPVFAWLASMLLLGEMLNRRAGLGALLVLAGIAITELQWGRKIAPEGTVL
jgi:drug/metabolite transporter (DMT)-like permease